MAKASNKGASAPRNTNPANGTNTPAPEATPSETAKAPEKAKRPPAIVQNGVSRPRAGGACAAVWELTEAGMVNGEPPSIAQVKEQAKEKGLNMTNVSIEYYRCRQFHGVRGRVKKAQTEAQTEAQPQQ